MTPIRPGKTYRHRKTGQRYIVRAVAEHWADRTMIVIIQRTFDMPIAVPALTFDAEFDPISDDELWKELV